MITQSRTSNKQWPSFGRLRMLLVSALLLLLVFLPSTSVSAAAATTHLEPRTKISFADKVQRQSLQKLGVRTKGPIKVYAVGQYSKSLFVLQMAMSVKAQQMSEALYDALKPRCAKLGCTSQIDQFKTFVFEALPNGAKKGTTLEFHTGGGKIALTVNGKSAGKINGKALAEAFAGIYTDSNAVCKLYPIIEKGDDSDKSRRNPEVTRTIAIIAATTIALFLYLTNPGPNAKVSGLFVYPIKSCAEQSVDEAVVTETGFEGDRVAMVVDGTGKCCTPRKSSSRLFHVTPKLDAMNDTLTLKSRHGNDPLTVDLSQSYSTKVTHNEAKGTLQVEDYGTMAASWLETATGISGCRLVGMGDDYQRSVQVNPDQGDPVPLDSSPVSLADEAPFLLCNEASLEDLNTRLVEGGKPPIDMRRFRPNIVVRNLPAWKEDTWSKIRMGGVDFFVWQRCGRCIMTTIDRDTLDRTAEPLATLSTFREREHGMRNFGMHLVPDPSTLGKEVSIGNSVEVLEYDVERLQEWKEQYESS